MMLEKLENPKNAASLMEIAKSGEVKELMSLLREKGGVEEAAKKATKGDATSLVSMVQSLLSSEQGATLIDNIQKQAKEAGLDS